MTATTLGDAVAQCQELLDTIKNGAVARFEAEAQEALAKQASALADATNDITGKVPVLGLTKNQSLEVSEGNTIPDDFSVSTAVTMEHVLTIGSNAVSRPIEVLTMLDDIEAGVKKDYPDFDIRKNFNYVKRFNIYRISWDFGANPFGWIFYPRYQSGAVPVSTVVTSAALVKLEYGSFGSHSLLTGAELGEWRFTHEVLSGDHYFGRFHTASPMPSSKTGAMLIALPIEATGFIDHPNKLLSIPEVA